MPSTVYVALLRGINVGGKATIPMSLLAEVFRGLDFQNVETYINSGNVIFRSKSASARTLSKRIEAAIDQEFGLKIMVLVRNLEEMQRLLAAIPKTWINDQESKCDVLFLAEEADRPSLVKDLPAAPKVDVVKYSKGAILWRVNRKLLSKSRMTKIIGTALYKNMTVRNVNTVRKLLELMQVAESAK